MDISKLMVMDTKEGIIIINQSNLEMLGVDDDHVQEAIDAIKNDKKTEVLDQFRKEVTEENFPEKYLAESNGIAIFPTLRCNLSCTYCFEKNYLKDEMTLDMIPYIKKFIERWNQKFGVNITTEEIALMGGEIFREEVRDLLEKIYEEFPNSKYSLTTNGVELINFKDWIRKTKPEMAFSIDGTKEMQLERRRTKVENSYERIMEGLRFAVSEGLQVNISCILNPGKFNAEDYMRFLDQLEELGWLKNDKIELTFCTELLEGGLEFDKQVALDTIALFEELLEKDERVQYISRGLLASAARLESSLLEKIETGKISEPYCVGSMMGALHFFPDGKVYTCNMVRNEQNCIGTFYPEFTINQDSIDALVNRNIRTSKKCADCDRVLYCKGGCPATSVGRLGDVKEGFCGIWKDPDLYEKVDLVVDVEKLYKAARKYEP